MRYRISTGDPETCSFIKMCITPMTRLFCLQVSILFFNWCSSSHALLCCSQRNANDETLMRVWSMLKKILELSTWVLQWDQWCVLQLLPPPASG